MILSKGLIKIQYHQVNALYTINAFFNSASVLLNFLMNWALMLLKREICKSFKNSFF